MTVLAGAPSGEEGASGLLSPPRLSDPHLHASGVLDSQWSRLCVDTPMAWMADDRGEYLSLFAHRLVVAAYRRPVLFSSRWGLTLDNRLAQPDPAAGRMLELTDPPRHRAIKHELSEAVSRDRLQRIASTVEASMRDLVMTALATGTVDVVPLTETAATTIALAVIGAPLEDASTIARLARQSADTTASAPGVVPPSRHANIEIVRYFSSLIDAGGTWPAGSVLDLFASRVDASLPIPTKLDLAVNCFNVLMGGTQTMRHALTRSIELLATYPEVLATTRSAPSLVTTAVEELIRLATPGMHLHRRATAGTQLVGVPIGAGTSVVLWNVAANRDPSVFADPDEFRFDRRPNPHLGFAAGEHSCIASGLARLELTTLLVALAQHVASVRLTGRRVRLPSNFLHGYEVLDVTFDAR